METTSCRLIRAARHVGMLLDQFDRRYSLFGHRHFRCRFQVSQPEPFPKIDEGSQRHVRPPTPSPGTLQAWLDALDQRKFAPVKQIFMLLA